MIDAECLAFGKGFADVGKNLAGAFQVPADWLFDNYSGKGAAFGRTAHHAGRFEMIDAHLDRPWRNGKIKHPAAGSAELLVNRFQPRLELGISASVVKAAVYTKQRPGKMLPMVVLGRTARIPGRAVAGALAYPLIGIALRSQAEPNYGEI